LFSTVAKQLFLKLDPETVGNVRFLKDIKWFRINVNLQ
jgi:hypothetical protein